jgi:probable rRNA maturation factor
MAFTLNNTTKEDLPKHPYKKMAEKVLGKKYDLSLTIVDKTHIANLNSIYRHKNTPTDILSFPLSKTAGEIFICLSEAKNEAVSFKRSYDNFIGFLFIHGLMHLKGFDHSSTMESNEQIIRSQFHI